MKKMLTATLVVIFMGVPSFVMANPCVPGDADYIGINCSAPVMSGDYSAPAQAAPVTGSSGGLLGGTPGGSNGPSLSANAKIQNPIKYDTFSAFAAAVTKTAVQVLLPFIVLAFIYSGFLFVKAQGNDTELTNAKNVLWYSVLGAFILLGAWGFAQIIGQTVSTITQ